MTPCLVPNKTLFSGSRSITCTRTSQRLKKKVSYDASNTNTVLKSLALGYEDLESVSLLSEEEIDELATSIKMRPGHRRKLQAVMSKVRAEMKEQEEIQKREKEEAEEKRKRERTKRQREEEEQEETLKQKKALAKIQREQE